MLEILGKTRLLNFFNLDDKYMFVDVPGYGYAKISKTQLLKFGQMMEDYFSQRKQKKEWFYLWMQDISQQKMI